MQMEGDSIGKKSRSLLFDLVSLLAKKPYPPTSSTTCLFKATVYTHLTSNLTRAAFCPPSPPILGGTGIQSPPKLGDLGGGKDSNEVRPNLCVHRSQFMEGKGGSKRVGRQVFGLALFIAVVLVSESVAATPKQFSLPEPNYIVQGKRQNTFSFFPFTFSF